MVLSELSQNASLTCILMGTSIDIQLGLDDLLADLHYARRNHDFGRLALLAYCEVRSWARQAGMPGIAQNAAKMFTESPCISREEFLEKIDQLIATLEGHQKGYHKARMQYLQPVGAFSRLSVAQ